jgi:uncharacterized protein
MLDTTDEIRGRSMTPVASKKLWEPLPVSERYTTLDMLRGFALFGVLLVNLLCFYRISLFDYILRFHTSAGWANHAVDLMVAELLEFKAFELFSLTFGIGVAVQAERARARGVHVEPFLARRFAILLGFGICHMLLISNIDILTLYAVCGLLLIPFLRVPTAVLAIAGLAAIYLPSVLPASLPPAAVLRVHIASATRVYGEGSFASIFLFRWRETRELIAPLLVGSLQRTFGLMLLGIAIWRAGIVRDPAPYRRMLWVLCGIAGAVGLVNTTTDVWFLSSRKSIAFSPVLESLGSSVNLALAYAAALLAWKRSPWAAAATTPFAAAGRMALSNYLGQTIAFAVLFYGYGFGLFGKLPPSTTAVIGIVFYGVQLWLSVWWLRRFRFGPFEWLWRSLTYGRRQPMRIAVR